MGCKSILRYAKLNMLYKDIYLTDIADEHQRKTGEEAVIVVDGVGCVRYLYRNCDSYCGGQYKEFRESCRNFVQNIVDCGVQLVMFFQGLPRAVKNEKPLQASKDRVGKAGQLSEKLHEDHAQLPEGLVPFARVIFASEPSTKVRLSMGDVYQEAARFAANCKNCLGVMSNSGNVVVYKDVPSLFTFDKYFQWDGEVRMIRFRSSDIASHLGIRQEDLPAFATFMGNKTINLDELRHVHGRLGSRYGRRDHLANLVAELVKSNTVEEMCRIAFGHRWREFLESVRASIEHYAYKPTASESSSEKSTNSEVLQCITTKHSSGELPAVVLSVVKCHTAKVRPALEDLPHLKCDGKATGEALQKMRSRMYTVLLWESGEGPFYVQELVMKRSDVHQTRVEVQKWLPPRVVHPGLLKLWAGDAETRWRLFSWIVGAPDPEGSALRSLKPQSLAVPSAALYFLRHEARLLERHEAEVFAVVAATVGRFTPQELARKHSPTLDPRAVFLAALFVRTALHVLEAAAVCGLSFPMEADCQLDAYFDGKFFHDIYLKAKAQSFSRIGTHTPWDPSYLAPIHQLLAIVEGSHSGSQ